MSKRDNIAVIGGGVAGITAAHLLQRCHEVTLFEKDARLGGHTNTITLENGPDAGTAVDTGFIVLNDRTYPRLHKLLTDLGVAVRWSNMSFSYFCEQSGFSYAGTSVNGLFANRINALKPRFYRFLSELARFCREAEQALGRGEVDDITMRAHLERGRFSADVVNQYILPMGAAIWSAPRDEILEFPARTFLRFFHNHGLLALRNRPRWQTVVGGSKSYVLRFAERFQGSIRLSAEVEAVRRGDGFVEVISAGRPAERFDKVVIAAHADQALKLLSEPTPEEHRLLGSWRYQRNHTVLHTDQSALPPKRRAWASWNYIREKGHLESAPVSVTYHMNRLQGLDASQEYCVTLNRNSPLEKNRIIYETEYLHPVYDGAAVATHSQLPSLNGKNQTYFCGSYFGYGFHEDAVSSGAEVASLFGVQL